MLCGFTKLVASDGGVQTLTSRDGFIVFVPSPLGRVLLT